MPKRMTTIRIQAITIFVGFYLGLIAMGFLPDYSAIQRATAYIIASAALVITTVVPAAAALLNQEEPRRWFGILEAVKGLASGVSVIILARAILTGVSLL